MMDHDGEHGERINLFLFTNTTTCSSALPRRARYDYDSNVNVYVVVSCSSKPTLGIQFSRGRQRARRERRKGDRHCHRQAGRYLWTTQHGVPESAYGPVALDRFQPPCTERARGGK